MLILEVPSDELWDEYASCFIHVPNVTLRLEHSLASLARWESKWKKSFINTDNKTPEESLDYVRCMTLNDEYISPVVYERLPRHLFEQVNTYIEDSMTATWFNDPPGRKSRDIITAEIIYHWMVALQIPFTCEDWHLNRLLTLVKVCNAKNNPGKKMNRKEILSQNGAINEARKALLGTTG